MTKTEKAWLAGIIDGEGCIFISRTLPDVYGKKTKTIVYRLGLKITMGHLPTIKRLVLMTKLIGTFQNHQPRRHKTNASYTFLATSRRAGKLIRELYPYLFTKREEADIALKFLELPLSKLGGRDGSNRTSPALEHQRFILWKAMRMAKPRNRFKSKRQSTFPLPLSENYPRSGIEHGGGEE